MIKFLLDAGVPRTIQKFLKDQGYKAVHVADIGLMSAIDGDIYDYAQSHSYILITRDKGFGNLLEYASAEIGIVVIKDLNLGAREIAEIFVSAWAEISTDQLSGVLVIIDRNKVRIRRY